MLSEKKVAKIQSFIPLKFKKQQYYIMLMDVPRSKGKIRKGMIHRNLKAVAIPRASRGGAEYLQYLQLYFFLFFFF